MGTTHKPTAPAPPGTHPTPADMPQHGDGIWLTARQVRHQHGINHIGRIAADANRLGRQIGTKRGPSGQRLYSAVDITRWLARTTTDTVEMPAVADAAAPAETARADR